MLNSVGIFGILNNGRSEAQNTPAPSIAGGNDNVSVFQSRIEQLNNEKNNYDNEIEQGNQDTATFTAQQGNASDRVESTNQAMTDASTALTDAQNQLNAAMAIQIPEANGENDEEIKNLTAQRDAAIAEAQAKVAQAQEAYDKAAQENTQAKQEYESVSEKLEALEESLNEIQGQKTDVEAQIQEAQKNLDEAKKAAEAQKAEEAKKAKETKESKEAEKSEEAEKNISAIPGENAEAEKDENNTAVVPGESAFENGEKSKVTKKDRKKLTKNAEILLDPKSHSKKEIEEARKTVEDMTSYDFDTDNKDVAKYKKILVNLNDKEINIDTEKRQETVNDINKLNGVSEQTMISLRAVYGEEAKGIKEKGGDNHGDMEKYYLNAAKEAGNAWCATFVSWANGKGQKEYKKDGEKVKTDNKNTFGYEVSVSELRDSAIKSGYYGKASKYAPVPGDIMIQKENGASHTGMVVKTDDKYIYTIEGNAGDKVRAKKYRIGGKAYQKISGYVKMNKWSGGKSAPLNVDYNNKIKFEDADKHHNQSTL